MYTVTKEYTFDSAHRLVNGYKGKCAHVHGHTWRVRFSVSSDRLNDFGFVRDFGDFKPLKEYIDEILDHAMLLNSSDTVMLDFCVANGQKHFAMNGNPTSEYLARHLLLVARGMSIPVSAVEVDETCTSNARYTP